MGGGLRLRTVIAGAAVLLAAASAAVLGADGASAAPGASAGAAPNLSMSVSIASQTEVGSGCDWNVTFNVTITNSSHTSATVTSVSVGSYGTLNSNGGLTAGTALPYSTSTFTNLSSNGGPSGGAPPCPTEAPDPLVLTVNTSAGTVTWNQSVSDPLAVTGAAVPQNTSAVLNGSFDVANCNKYYFEYGTTTNYGTKVDTTTSCANDGTATQFVSFNATGLQPNTTYHYRFVVMSKMGSVFHGQDVQFTTGGTTTVPIGSVGLIGLAALAGIALFFGQRWRRSRRTV